MKNTLAGFAVMALLCTMITADENHRLSKHLRPVFYTIEYKMDVYTKSYQASNLIDVECNNYASHIEFHSVNLTILNIEVIDKTEKQTLLTKWPKHNYHHEIISVEMMKKDSLKPTHGYTIRIYFKGNLSTDTNKGFFIIPSKDKSVKHLSAMTRFEPTYARRAFPCLDEPQFKVPYIIRFRIRVEFKLMINYRLEQSFPYEFPGIIVYEVKDIPLEKIPTHQVGFYIFYKTERKRASKYAYYYPYEENYFYTNRSERMWWTLHSYLNVSDLRNDSKPLGGNDYANGVFGGVRTTVANISVPEGGVSSFAMLFVSKEMSSVTEQVKITKQQSVFLSTANLLLQQWFGAMIVPEWWNYVWLNKGLITYLKYTIVDNTYERSNQYPMFRWNLKKYRRLSLLREAVEADTLENTRALSQVDDLERSNCSVYFDAISYQKGAVVFLTVKNMLGGYLFRKILYNYLTTNQAEVVRPEHFMKAIETVYKAETKQNFTSSSFLDSWANNRGVPVLSATRSFSDNTVYLSQKRFASNKQYGSGKWFIPINYASDDKQKEYFKNTEAMQYFHPSNKTIKLNATIAKEANWFIINTEASFYYLVNYDEMSWKRLACALDRPTLSDIPPMTRGKLLHDVFTLAKHGELKYSVALEFIKYLSHETEYITLDSFFNVFEFFYLKFSRLEYFDHLKKYLASIFGSLIPDAQWFKSGGSDLEILKKAQIIKWACLLGNQRCRDLATNALATNDYRHVNGDLKEAIICAGLINANLTFWKYIYYKTNDSEVYDSLVCSQKPSAINTYILNHIRNHTGLKQLFSKGNYGMDRMTTFLLANFSLAYGKLGDDALEDVAISSAQYIIDSTHLSNWLSFFNKMSMDLRNYKTSVPQVMAKVDAIASKNLRWIKQHAADINNWIKREIPINLISEAQSCDYNKL